VRKPGPRTARRGSRRGRSCTKGVRPGRNATPGVLRLMLGQAPLPGHATGCPRARHGAAGFGAALRRSEPVALTLGDVESIPGRGPKILMRRGKTDHRDRDSKLGSGPTRRSWRPAPSPPSRPGSPTGAASLDLDRDRQRRSPRRTPAVLRCDQRRPHHRQQVVRRGRSPPRQAGRLGRRTASRALFRALAARRTRHRRRRSGRRLAEPMRQTQHTSTEVALGYLRPADLWRNYVTERVLLKSPVED
jgi:hypothetical protein